MSSNESEISANACRGNKDARGSVGRGESRPWTQQAGPARSCNGACERERAGDGRKGEQGGIARRGGQAGEVPCRAALEREGEGRGTSRASQAATRFASLLSSRRLQSSG